MKTNREKIDETLVKLKELMKSLPADEKIFIYWALLREPLKENMKGVFWVYWELGRLIERKFQK